MRLHQRARAGFEAAHPSAVSERKSAGYESQKMEIRAPVAEIRAARAGRPLPIAEQCGLVISEALPRLDQARIPAGQEN